MQRLGDRVRVHPDRTPGPLFELPFLNNEDVSDMRVTFDAGLEGGLAYGRGPDDSFVNQFKNLCGGQ